jgi:hypothetical protein
VAPDEQPRVEQALDEEPVWLPDERARGAMPEEASLADWPRDGLAPDEVPVWLPDERVPGEESGAEALLAD